MCTRSSFLLGFLFLPAACSAPTGPTGSAESTTVPTAAELRNLCDSECARTARCDPANASPEDAGISCSDSCLTDLGSLATNVRADVTRSLVECYTALPCGTNDDGCLTEAVVKTGQQVDAALHAPDVQACLRKHDECRETAGAFSDDLCGTLPVLVDSSRSRAARCFDGTCDGVAACLGPIVGGH